MSVELLGRVLGGVGSQMPVGEICRKGFCGPGSSEDAEEFRETPFKDRGAREKSMEVFEDVEPVYGSVGCSDEIDNRPSAAAVALALPNFASGGILLKRLLAFSFSFFNFFSSSLRSFSAFFFSLFSLPPPKSDQLGEVQISGSVENSYCCPSSLFFLRAGT
jgi:hypothetical protein